MEVVLQRAKSILEDFFQKFHSDLVFYRFLWQINSRRCSCGRVPTIEIGKGRCRRCACGKEVSVTAGTFFHKAKKVRNRVATLVLRVEGIVLNINQIHFLIDMSYSATWGIEMRTKLLSESELSDELTATGFAFLKVIGRRSRETPAREHPSAEVLNAIFEETCDAGEIAYLDRMFAFTSDCETPFGFHEHPHEHEPEASQNSVDERDSAGQFGAISKPVGARLNNITLLYSSPDNTDNPAQSSILKNLTAIRHRCGTVSYKFMQPHIADSKFEVEKGRWTLETLLLKCMRFTPITRKDLRDYVSPQTLKLVSWPTDGQSQAFT